MPTALGLSLRTMPKNRLAVCFTAMGILASSMMVVAVRADASPLSIRMIAQTGNWHESCATGPYCQTDDFQVHYWYADGGTSSHVECSDGANANVEADDAEEIAKAIWGTTGYHQTAINFHYDGTPVFTGVETDIIVQECSAGVPSGREGVASCDDPVDLSVDPRGVACDQFYVAFKPGKASQGLACHEFGHAVGFVHPEYMGNFPGSPNPNWYSCSKKSVTPGAGLSSEEEHNITHVYG